MPLIVSRSWFPPTSMRRSSPPFHFFATASSSAAPFMPLHPAHRGGRYRCRAGISDHGNRFFSDEPHSRWEVDGNRGFWEEENSISGSFAEYRPRHSDPGRGYNPGHNVPSLPIPNQQFHRPPAPNSTQTFWQSQPKLSDADGCYDQRFSLNSFPPYKQNQPFHGSGPINRSPLMGQPPPFNSSQTFWQSRPQPDDPGRGAYRGPPFNPLPPYNQNQAFDDGSPPLINQNLPQPCNSNELFWLSQSQPKQPRRGSDQTPLHNPLPHYTQNQTFYRSRPINTRPGNPNQTFRQFQPRHTRPSITSVDYRNWDYARRGYPSHNEKFIVLSYNILADYLAFNHRSRLYYHIPRNFLDWEWRKRSIIFELGLWSADIMCFQEVDRFQDLEAELMPQGYSGIWKMRTGNAIDGCAIFWRASRFKLLHAECIEYNMFGMRDNVAQICVLELLGPNYNAKESTLPTSSTNSKKVVICNIHVLYNPRRGEIKLGQVRELLQRARSVSKAWNGAPIVLCGDFNSTPKSPLYNFMSGQKLILTELDRDKISGQASAEIQAPRPYRPNKSIQPPVGSSSFTKGMSQLPRDETTSAVFNNLGGPCGEENPILSDELTNKTPSNATGVGKNQTYTNGGVDRKQDNPDGSVENVSVIEGLSQLDEDETRSLSDQSIPNFCLSGDRLNQNQSKSQNSVGTHGNNYETEPRTAPHNITISSDMIKTGREGKSGSSFPPDGLLCHDNQSNTLPQNISIQSNEATGSHLGADDHVDESQKECRNSGEDCESFLSELRSIEDYLPSDFGENVSADAGKFEYSKKFNAAPSDIPSNMPTDEVIHTSSFSMSPVPADAEQMAYDQTKWTGEDIATATGDADSTVLENPLKLKSTYTETEDRSGTRDLNGEPMVTSYNRSFFGTVDYIWRSEGLETVKVLAPFRKEALQWTPGYPTKKWGSDHIALASELVFTEGMVPDHPETQ